MRREAVGVTADVRVARLERTVARAAVTVARGRTSRMGAQPADANDRLARARRAACCGAEADLADAALGRGLDVEEGGAELVGAAEQAGLALAAGHGVAVGVDRELCSRDCDRAAISSFV